MEMKLKGDYFEGQFQTSQTADEQIKKLCPADLTHELWNASVHYNHIDSVINSAITGFQIWRKLSLNERAEYLKRFQLAVRKRKDEIATAIALEVGKPLWEAKTEAQGLDSKVDVTLHESRKRIEMESIQDVLPKITGHVVYKPIGPSLIIGPFNFPCHLANGQILSSLLAGNSIIFKPSEKTIYSSQLLIECFHEAGFPSGVINLINGTGYTSSKLTSDSRIKAIFFTGSKTVGLKILENTHKDLGKMVALELGGKNSTIIHHDTNIDHALPELLRACFLTSGQRCTSTSIILIHRNIEKQFIDAFTKITKKIMVGHPTKSKVDPFMGTVIDAHAEKLYFDFCKTGLNEGAEELIKPTKLDVGFNGHYVSPSIHYMSKAKTEGKFFQEEIFGPNCCFIPYDSIEEAIEIANSTRYGLAASIFTRDPELYKLAVRDLDAGLINLNRSTVGAAAKLPFGGVKDSGNFKPAAVSMIDYCVSTVASLETLDDTSSKISDVVGLSP